MVDALKRTKEEVIQLLNAGLELRKELFRTHYSASSSSSTTAGDLSRIGKLAFEKAKEINHKHAISLSKELLIAARIHLAMQSDAGDKDFDSLEPELSSILSSAKEFGDVYLALRCLELLAIVHNISGETYKEVHVSEQAVVISRTPQAVVSLIGAYWRLIEAANISLVTETAKHSEAERKRKEYLSPEEADRDVGELESETMKKLRDFWHELEYLSGQSKTATAAATNKSIAVTGFNMDEFLKRFKTPVFAVCIYIGTMLANPFVSQWKQEDINSSKQAFEMATKVAILANDNESICCAVAFRIRAFYGRATQTEQQQMISELKVLENEKHPVENDIRDLLRDIEKQQGAFPNEMQGNGQQTQQIHSRIVEQLQRFRQRQQSQQQNDEENRQ